MSVTQQINANVVAGALAVVADQGADDPNERVWPVNHLEDSSEQIPGIIPALDVAQLMQQNRLHETAFPFARHRLGQDHRRKQPTHRDGNRDVS